MTTKQLASRSSSQKQKASKQAVFLRLTTTALMVNTAFHLMSKMMLLVTCLPADMSSTVLGSHRNG